MAVDQIEEDAGPLEAEDVGPDPYDDDEADRVTIKGDYKKQASSDRATAAPPTFRARPCPPSRPAQFSHLPTQFSAERTTNQWVMLGIKSGGLSIGLLSAGQYEPEIKMAGTLLLIPSIFCALWGGMQYRRRTNNIEALSEACHPRHHSGEREEEGEGREGRRRPRARVRSSIRQGTAEPRRALERDCSTCSGPLLRRRRPAQDSLASFEDRFGTTVAVASLSLAVCVNAAFSLMRYFDNV